MEDATDSVTEIPDPLLSVTANLIGHVITAHGDMDKKIFRATMMERIFE
ncbi:hypothetical protein OH492_27270 [Vibrio chagasii]|nr:hypothetical protein [Vibrio chagasii]